MKIHTCKVMGFGKLHNEQYFFSDGMNIIYGKNEAGKTTLKTFLVSMLFGIERKRGIAAKKDEYHRYLPYEGMYGGVLEIEDEKKAYRIQRDFKDPLEITVYERNLGNKVLERKELTSHLFSMSRQAYLQTLCVSQGEIRTDKTLRRMLGDYFTNLSESKTADIHADRAVAYLKKEIKKLPYEQVQEEIKRVREQIALSKDGEAKWNQIEEQRKELFQKIKQLGRPQTLWEKIKCWIRKIFHLVDQREFERQQYEHELELLRFQQEELEKKREFNEDLRIRLEKLKKESEEIAYNREAMTEALQAICEAAKEIHETFGSSFQEKVSSIIASMTNGAYEKIHIDETMGMTVEKDGTFLDIDHLSTGTVEQIYFAVRVAAAQLMFPDESFPIILDDVFGNFDDVRLQRTLSYLSELDEQILIFTCRKDVLAAVKQVGCKYHSIEIV